MLTQYSLITGLMCVLHAQCLCLCWAKERTQHLKVSISRTIHVTITVCNKSCCVVWISILWTRRVERSSVQLGQGHISTDDEGPDNNITPAGPNQHATQCNRYVLPSKSLNTRNLGCGMDWIPVLDECLEKFQTDINPPPLFFCKKYCGLLGKRQCLRSLKYFEKCYGIARLPSWP